MRCSCPDDSVSVADSLRCFTSADRAQPCVHRATEHAQIRGWECAEAGRGFFVLSYDGTGRAVCSAGDAYHLWSLEKHGAWRFAALSQPVRSAPNAYWMNLSASAAIPATSLVYNLTLSLIETPLRAQQLAEGRPEGLRWSTDGPESPLQHRLRDTKCVWQRVELPEQHRTLNIARRLVPPMPKSLCRMMPDDFSYRRVGECESGPGQDRCTQVRRHVIDTSNEQRLTKRKAQGFEHVLESRSCQLQWFGESKVERCLADRQLLSLGGEALDLQRGFARLNRTLVSWTRVRPGKLHPNVADFHRAFEKPWQQCFLPRGHCDVRFGAGRVLTILKRGLIDLIPHVAESSSTQLRQRGKARSQQEVLKLMCKHDVVVFGSGIEDVSLPLTRFSPLRDYSVLQPACSGRPAAECAAVLPAAIKNESWREAPLAAYRSRLSAMMNVWRSCRDQNARWRGIFKLASAPRARAIRQQAELADCSRAQSGYGASAPHLAVVNAVARQIVEGAGFEVFDPWAATLHAAPSWFDALPTAARGSRRAGRPGAPPGAPTGLEYEIHDAEAVSDMVTQMLLNQLCNAGSVDR